MYIANKQYNKIADPQVFYQDCPVCPDKVLRKSTDIHQMKTEFYSIMLALKMNKAIF